ATTQVKGGYYTRPSQACAIARFVERLERGLYPLRPLAAAELAARAPSRRSRSVIFAGISPGLGVALARAHARPGASLCLIGAVPRILAEVAEDCRRRGAAVEVFCATDANPAPLRECLTKLDADATVDKLVVQVDPA